jgi:hypothetical protein
MSATLSCLEIVGGEELFAPVFPKKIALRANSQGDDYFSPAL